MSGTSPNFVYWSKLATIRIWEVAVLMHGFDPRALADAMVASRDPSCPDGEPLDYTDEIRVLSSAVLAKQLTCGTGIQGRPDRHSEIIVAELVPWLRARGYQGLADNLSPAGTTAAVTDSTAMPETKAQREDRRLQLCIDAGLDMSDHACRSRLPHGVGAVADRDGVSRQAFSADVRSALTRRQARARAGSIVHRL